MQLPGFGSQPFYQVLAYVTSETESVAADYQEIHLLNPVDYGINDDVGKFISQFVGDIPIERIPSHMFATT